ncbi:MAG: DedA family protein [Alphaproteobacteria bacterium]
MMDLVHRGIDWLVEFTGHLGVIGLFVMTFVEASVLPVPTEATLIPAGYLVEEGSMNLAVTLIVSTLGTLAGACFNYWLAARYGRALLVRFGRYVLMDEAKLNWFERFFAEHGAISTFTGRILPGLRHYISLPAGLARMDRREFVLYSTLGGAICCAILVGIGYFIGANQELAHRYLPLIKLAILGALVLFVAFYAWRRRRKTVAQ